MSDNVIRKNPKLSKPLSIMVDDHFKQLYDTLSARGVRVSEHMRMVIYPELERLQKLEPAS